jgi:predicted nucleic-acid-binding protein
MIALKEGRGSFADALIAVLGAKAGCSRTLTFDHKALRIAVFELA